MANVSFLLAFSSGLLSFLSPCVLPLIPGYVTYLTGYGLDEMEESRVKWNVLYKSIGFIIGFSLIFVIMGASISTLGKIFSKNQGIIRQVSGILIILFGLHTTGIFKIKVLYKEKRANMFGRSNGSMNSILVGMAFAAGWTPCVGPILSSILLYAGTMETIDKGILLLIIYSLGLAVPFILTAMTIVSFAKNLKKYSRYLPTISAISGILMIIMGILVFTNKFSILSQYLNFINF